ncbi:tyrosine-type recombinase/integrase [Salmonella enterica]|nr:tyrosine-type recombinase/integrase [Salmonella enterica]
MTYTYISLFAGRMHRFVQQKNAVGFPYHESMRLLRDFDRFCFDRFPTETALTKEICLAWAVRKNTEGNNTFRNRLMPVREFARYLNRCGEPAFVLHPNFAKKGQRHIPHIYSEKEIAELWHVLDHLRPRKNYPIRHFVIPTFVRLLYCCGLRPGEVRKLRTADVNLEKGRLNIMESKGHKSRIVMMADDVSEMCRRYNEIVSRLMPGRELFFPNSDGNMYSKEWQEKTFRIAKIKAGIGISGNHSPRLYDLRHTFATHRLYQWLHEGKDVTAMLPYLSAYMGHKQLSDTYYYIHLVPGLFEKMAGFDFSASDFLLPEVECDE